MAQMTLPAEPAYKRTSYSKLLGADFSSDPSLVDSRHSPDLLNMISDNGNNPIKRRGWEIVIDHTEGVVQNIWSFKEDGNRVIVYSVDVYDDVLNTTTSTLYAVDEEGTALLNVTLSDAGKRIGLYINTSDSQHGFYVIDPDHIIRLYFNSGTLTSENLVGYVPTVIISRAPTGGGVQYEEINLINRYRKEQFLNTASNKKFKLSSKTTKGRIRSIKYKIAPGDDDTSWSDLNSTQWSMENNDIDYTVVLDAVYSPVPPGEDNIIIEYIPYGVDSSAGSIRNCTVSARYSATAQDQIFVTGNPEEVNRVYYCYPDNIAYWPDTNYIQLSGETEVKGFANLGEYLAVVKESTAYDSTIFLVYQTSLSSKAVTASDGSVTTTQIKTFAVKRASTGVGAISGYAFGVLNDEPLFLAPTGVHGIISTNLTSEKVVRNRSAYLDKKLLAESLDDLTNAVACVWNNYYLLFVNEHVYVLDGRHRSNDASGNTNYKYEAYYWDNVPAVTVTSYDDEIWFGTDDGRICRFKNSGEPTDYSDGTDPNDDEVTGDPIVAVWSTPNDNDGYTEYYKKMMKKGTMATLAPFDESSVNVYIRKDSGPRIYIGSWFIDISNMFYGVKFDRLSFDSREGPRDIMFRKKQKKYQRLQIILENNKLNEPFGIYEIVKTYIMQRYAKGPLPYNALEAGNLDTPTWVAEEE